MTSTIIHDRIEGSAQGELTRNHILSLRSIELDGVVARDPRETPGLSAIAELERVPHEGNDERIDSARNAECIVKHSLGDRVVNYPSLWVDVGKAMEMHKLTFSRSAEFT